MEKKSIAKNSIYNVIYKGFTALFPLLTTSYISRVLLADGVGKVAYVNTIVTYFVTIAALGLPNYGVKVIAQKGNSKEERSKTFIELFLINFISTIICIVAYFLFVNINPHFSDRRDLFNIMGIMLILNIFNIDWLYQGIEEYGYIAARSVIVKILSFIAMLIFVKNPEDCLKYALILVIALAGNYIFNITYINRYIFLKRYHLDIKRHLKPVFILLASAIATEVYTMLDTIILEYYHGDIYVGYYSNAVKIVRMIYTVVIALVATFYPRISYYLKDKKINEANKLLLQGTKIILIFAIPCTLGVGITSEYMVPILFGDSFMPAINTLRILSVLIFVFSIAYFLGHIVLIASNNEKYILKATLCGAVINAIFNFILIPRMYQNGAAIASVIAELIVTSVLMLHSRKIISIQIDYKFWISEIMASLSLFAIIIIIKLFVKDVWVAFGLSVIVGGFTYFVVLITMKNEMIMAFLQRILKDNS